MKAILVESSNGYMAKNATDPVDWSPSLDKKIFNMLTTVGGVCVCSKYTYGVLPQKMLNDPARQFIIAERTGDKSLQSLNVIYPNAYLIGGPTFLKAAYDAGVVDMIIINTMQTPIESTDRYKNPFHGNLPQPIKEIRFDELTVRIYKI